MSAPEEDFAERSRSIFERLRAEQQAAHEQPEPAPGAEGPGNGSVDSGSDQPRGDEASAESATEPEAAHADPVDEVHTVDVRVDANDPASASGSTPAPPDTELDWKAGGGGLEHLDDPLAEVSAEDIELHAWASADVEPGTAHDEGPLPSDEITVDAGHQPWDEGPIAEASVGDRFADIPEEDLPPEPVAFAEGDPDPAPVVDLVAEEYRSSGIVIEETPIAMPPEVVEEVAAQGGRQEAAVLDPLRFVRPLPRVLAIANQKGGVGKTTTTVNLGASLAVLGYRVLVIDLDPQGNATTGLGINSRNLDSSIYDVILHDTPLDDCVEPTSLRNLFVAPATIDLAGAEIELVPAFSRELRLRRALDDVKEDYDFILIDCPPSLGLLTVNALAAASEIVVPIQCEYYALEGLGQLLRNVNLVQSNLNPQLEMSAIVLTMYDARTKLAEQVADEVRQHFGDRVCRNVVPRTVRLSEAPSFGQPIIVFDPSSRGALAYRELAKEVSGGPPQRTG